MSTAEMTERIGETSPRFKARLAGVFEALEGLTSALGHVIVLGRPVVFDNAAATAANILEHERSLWLGFASSLIGVAFHIAWTPLFYDLVRPVNRSLSSLAAFVSLVVCAIQALTSLLYLAPLLVFEGGSSVSASTAEQLQTLALILLRFLAPPLATHLFPFIAAASGFAEIPLQLWLLVVGVNVQRWKEQANAAGVRA